MGENQRKLDLVSSLGVATSAEGGGCSWDALSGRGEETESRHGGRR